MVLRGNLRLEEATKGFPSKFWGIEHGQGVSIDGYAGGERQLWITGVCVRIM